MHRYVYYYRRIEEIFCQKNSIVRFYKTNSGLKNVNASLLLGYHLYSKIDVRMFDVNELYLGPDFLKDDATLLGCKIIDSPHKDFMMSLHLGKPIMDTDYLHRRLNGTLDWRRGTILPKDNDFYQRVFIQKKTEVESGGYSPITVYVQGGKYYIFDGKHRAALCAILGLPINCMVVDSEIANSNLWHYMFSIIENDPSYSCHTTFHSEYLNSLTNGK